MKMKTLLALAICFMFVGVGSISAQTETGILYKKHTFELEPEISYRTYKEPDSMREKSMLYGIVVSYTYHKRIMLKAEGIGSIGWVHFSDAGQIDNIRDIRGLGGYDFPILKSSILTPYIGIGYSHLNDDFSGKTSTIWAWFPAYEREYTYIYSPIGTCFLTGLGDRWSLRGIGEYDLFWLGKQKNHIPVSGFNDEYNDIETHQRKGFGLRGSIALEKTYKKVIFEGGPFIRYWNIKKSEIESQTYYGIPVGSAWEPKNNTTEVGIMLGVRF